MSIPKPDLSERMGRAHAIRQRKPSWLRVKLPGGRQHHEVKQGLREAGLCTVCEEARCPNLAECFGARTATFMILGEACTRHCRFCAVSSTTHPGAPDAQEPQKIARAVQALALKYAVITCVTRDDLPDGGALHMAQTIRAIRELNPHTLVEVLTSDYQGDEQAIRIVLEAEPDVFAHNVETVKTLTPAVRDRHACYETSLKVLATAHRLEPGMLTKSSLMLGLGETRDQVESTLRDLRAVHVEALTMGQYLRPGPQQVEVKEYVTPEAFQEWQRIALDMGFKVAACGPLVRSSYRAAEAYLAATTRNMKIENKG